MRWIAFCLIATFATASLGAPVAYQLDSERTEVGFTWYMGPDGIVGRIPVKRAELEIDFDQLSSSTISVTLDATSARAGFVFATQALRGPRMFDTENHPDIQFVGKEIIREGSKGIISGDLIVRGVTRTQTMEAEFFRQKGQAQGDLSAIVVILSGSVNRHDFGASGWPDMVGDTVDLKIVAYLSSER